MQCSNCKNEVSDDAAFCTHCGAKLSKAAPIEDTTEAASGAAAAETTSQTTTPAEAATQTTSAPSAEATPQTPITPTADTSTPSATKEPKKSKKKIWIIVAIVVVIVLIVGDVGFYLYNQEQQRLYDERVAEVTALAEEITNPATTMEIDLGESADLATLLEQYTALKGILDALNTAEQEQKFVLTDNSAYDISEYQNAITQKMDSISAWFQERYKKILADNTFPENASVDTVSQKDCEAKLTNLKALRSEVEAQSIIWGTGEENEARKNELLASIDAQIKVGDALLPQIKEKAEREAREQQLKEQANGFLGSWSQTYGSGANFNMTVLTFYPDGRLQIQTRFTEDFTTWKKYGGDAGGAVTISSPNDGSWVYDPADRTLRDPGGSPYTRVKGPIGS